jgi:hypothetical protein
VEFSRGRMWVFSDTGTTAAGEKLYAFTHRTFLEYFAAAQLAYDSDTPEKLARTIAPHIARGEWAIVGELAVQIKDATSRAGATRIYEYLLAERRHRSYESRSNTLQFLARCLRSVDPVPPVTRRLTREVVRFLFSGEVDSIIRGLPITWLLSSCSTCLSIVDEEISAEIGEMGASADPEVRLNGLRLAVSLRVATWGDWGGKALRLRPDSRLYRFWAQRTFDNVRQYAEYVAVAARENEGMRDIALWNDVITLEQALEMRGGLLSLLQSNAVGIFGWQQGAYLLSRWHFIGTGRGDDRDFADIARVGQYVIDHPSPPWVHGPVADWSEYTWPISRAFQRLNLPPLVALGAAVILLASAESNSTRPDVCLGFNWRVAPFSDMLYYMAQRYGPGEARMPLKLQIPTQFDDVFKRWAAGQINFVGPSPSSVDPDGSKSE